MGTCRSGWRINSRLSYSRSCCWYSVSVQLFLSGHFRSTEKLHTRVKRGGLDAYVPTRATIARCLAVHDAIYAWPKLVELYRAEPCTERYADGIKSDLAVAVAGTTTEENIPTLVELVRDRSNGSSRLHFLRKLRRSKNPLAKQALEDLATDPDLEKEIASWRKRRN